MANNSRINPMYADVASNARLVNDATKVTITGILCIPTNATWVVQLNDGVGNIIFYADNVAAGRGISPEGGFSTTGLVVATLTNAKVLIYTRNI
jgi:hypothetical protein